MPVLPFLCFDGYPITLELLRTLVVGEHLPEMDFTLLIKAGFLGFALSLGVLMLVFYIVGSFLRVWQKNFVRVFILAAVVSFVVVDLFLYYKIRVSQIPNPELFLAGCVGGWLGGIFSGLTQMKRFLLSLHK